MADQPDIVLFDFRQPGSAEGWQVISDTVMGGVSTSRFALRPEGLAVFNGNLSLKQSGGFALARCQPGVLDVSQLSVFAVRVRGDGRRYHLIFRTVPHFDYLLYQAPFTTRSGEWQEPHISFANFVPTFRGRFLSDAPAPDLARIASVGFLIADKQAGPFRLECEWIKAVGEAAPVAQRL